METTRGMIRALIASGEQIGALAMCKGDHGRDKCQEFHLIRVCGTHSLLNAKGKTRRSRHEVLAWDDDARGK